MPISLTVENYLSGLYVTLYGRAADAPGETFWFSRLGLTEAQASTQTITLAQQQQLAKEFVSTQADFFNANYANKSEADFILTLYAQLGGPNQQGIDITYWTTKLASFGGDRALLAAQFVNEFMSYSGDDAGGLLRQQTFNNKIAVSKVYADNNAKILVPEKAGATDAAYVASQKIIEGITESPTTVTTALGRIDSAVSSNDLTKITAAPTLPATTIPLTTGVDIKSGTEGADTFDGSVNANGQATLTSVDQLDGKGGTDTLIAGLAGGNIAAKLTSIENAEFITSAAATFDMINTTGLTSLLMRNSSGTLTVNNIAATTGTAFTAQDQAADFNLNFTNAALVGANAFTLSLSGAQSDNNGGAAVVIAQQAGSDTSGLETLTLASGGSTTNFLNGVTIQNAANTATLATLKVTGAQGLTVATDFAASVRTIDASGMTGALGLSAGFDATLAVTVTGSAGNDTLAFDSNSGDSSISAGAGNDVVSIAGFTTADTIAGGDGTADRLDFYTSSQPEGVAANLTNVTGFEQLSLRAAGTAAAAINATRFGAIDTVRLDAGTLGNYGLTMQAGTVNVQIGAPAEASNATLGGTLTVTDTGTATTDVLNLATRDTDTVSTTNNFNARAITSAGYETVNLNSGTALTVGQTTGVITINNDSLTAASALNVSGANSLTVDRIDSNSSGLLTVDASGLTGTAALVMNNAITFTVANGTVKATGSANSDTLLGPAAASATVDGGAGNDTITTGTKADSIVGGAGNDTITAGGGNDVVDAGDGNDSVTLAAGTVNVVGGAGNDTINMAATLTSGDTVGGGDGTDTLALGAQATAATAAGVTGFETLSIDAAFDQGMEQFTANTGFTRINYNNAGNVAVTNASATVDTIQVQAGAVTQSMTRLVDTSTNALTIVTKDIGNNGAAQQVLQALSVVDEETLTINTGTASDGTAANGTGERLTITTLTANDLTTLNVTGANEVQITNAIGGAANLATVNASGLTAAFTANAGTSTANLTFTGSFSASNVFTSGTGADSLTGGTAADTLTGGNGADTISGGAGADVLDGGLGADSISGDIGNDTITGGIGNDTLSGGDGADVFRFLAASNGADTITGFVSGTDDLDMVTNAVIGAVAGNTIINAAAAGAGIAGTLGVDDSVFYISMNGAAANLTTGGTATLSTADLTAATLTNLATYLGERFTGNSGANTNDAIIVINWTAGGSTSSYVYELINDGNANVLQAAELTLMGIVDRGTTVLTTGDII